MNSTLGFEHSPHDLLRLLDQGRLDSSRVLMTKLCTVDLLIIDGFALDPVTRDEIYSLSHCPRAR